MKIATWNVNGIRARQAQVQEWIERERPDVVCLQEIKAASDQVPDRALRDGGLLVLLARRQGLLGRRPARQQDARAGAARLRASRLRLRDTASSPSDARPAVTVASIYVPNGGKDFPAKMRFLEALDDYARALQRRGHGRSSCAAI